MRTLITETQLSAGVAQLAREIDAHYRGRPITVVAVLTGSVVLFADLIRRLSMPQRVGVIQASSYRGGTKPGELIIDAKMLIDVKNRDVLLVDDIFDTGATIAKLREELLAMGADSVATAVLLRKSREDQHSMRPDFIAFEIPDEFVVGYGLDYLDMYRNLPYIAILEPAEIAATAAEFG
ncbi:hypoxanthine phosphoribosyltransferase [Allorhodopirellula solitaria]|uniref:Hypoxanthine phosphoribosyltransferase n=1 Tax=Allorhodopirellula solitaria TaxID=2527987 RepID=A0A5C5XTT9_9BACT|nr:hypoxanthine phosphoribosyltransferase [Allorhodopirellula solitaria]TWT66118.1 Hypoxanthine-guanine phosphoribosyltransferase [Allorhodopirellula solitaria]